MSFTRDQLVTEARAIADAENDTRWSATTVLRHADVVFDREWGRVLASFPNLRLSHLTPSVDADGYVLKSDLNSGSADSLKRFYRIVGVRAGQRRYRPVDTSDYLLTPELGEGQSGYVYWWEGDMLRLSPPPASGETLTVTVTHRPQLPFALSAGSVAVTFPEPWEMLLAYGIAAQMLAKGGTETNAASDLIALADGMRDDMLADISRREQDPVMWRYSDRAADWNG